MKIANPKDYQGYFTRYMDLVEGEDVIHELNVMRNSIDEFYSRFANKAEFRYSEGKWTPKELIQHLIDAERVFGYRAMCFARKDDTPLQGYDHNEWVLDSNANSRSLDSLIEEMKALKVCTINLFLSLSEEVLDVRGEASGLEISPRAIASVIVGHEKHHRNVLSEKYL